MKAWILACLPCAFIACGGTFTAQSTQGQSDGGDTGGASAGGSPNAGGAQQAGGRATGGRSGPGGAVAAGGIIGAGGLIYPGGYPGMGGFIPGGGGYLGGYPGAGGLVPPGGRAGTGGIDCSNVGCGIAPVCGQPCGAPCGCCGCPDGQHQDIGGVDHICNNGCWSPAPSVDAGPSGCTHNGQILRMGEAVRMGDGCNTCTCSSVGGTLCTGRICSCDPASETHQRGYIGSSPQECALIDFVCASNTTPFQNSCGCGCEQGLACPDWFSCMPGSGTGCDIDKIKSECPYSGIAF